VDDHGCFLAVRRADNGHWELPGGVLELEESIEQGLIREVAEETGLRVQPLALTGVYKNMHRGVVGLVFRCCIVGERLRPSSEVDEIAWLAREELSRMSEAYRVRLLDAVEIAVEMSAPHVRAHDGAQAPALGLVSLLARSVRRSADSRYSWSAPEVRSRSVRAGHL
jgi:ADP-ribose pyrophosphatase YjhB (NUDIX family)